MKRPWLLLDCNYLCHRAFHTTGGLKNGPEQTGTVYGFLREVRALEDRFYTDKLIFCFDKGKSKRCKLYPAYKANRRRKEWPAETASAFYAQVIALEKEYLPALGYRNIWSREGFEADDLIARFVFDWECDVVIVSADKDLYQLLMPGVCMYNPAKKQTTTDFSFTAEWGISPSKWAAVKAIAGCSTDNIPGVKGVGEKTAAKFLSGKTNPQQTTKIVMGQSKKDHQRNLKLVHLPFEKTPSFPIRKNCVTSGKWQALANRLGMHTLREWK